MKFQNPLHNSYNFQRFGISSFAKGASGNVGETTNAGNSGKTDTSDKKAEKGLFSEFKMSCFFNSGIVIN